MPFDPAIFAAEVALGMIPFEQMPLRAQDALVAGFDGAMLVRLAGLERPSGWEVDQLVPRVLSELGVDRPNQEEAAIRLAKIRARRILDSGEDPLPSIAYFHRLFVKTDYFGDLSGLAYADEAWCGSSDDDIRQFMYEEAKFLLDPEAAALRRIERNAYAEERRRQLLADWPYVVKSPTGKKVFRERLREQVHELQRTWIFLLIGAIGFSWSIGRWIFLPVFLVIFPALGITMSAARIHRAMKYECQAFRWRHRIDV